LLKFSSECCLKQRIVARVAEDLKIDAAFISDDFPGRPAPETDQLLQEQLRTVPFAGLLRRNPHAKPDPLLGIRRQFDQLAGYPVATEIFNGADWMIGRFQRNGVVGYVGAAALVGLSLDPASCLGGEHLGIRPRQDRLFDGFQHRAPLPSGMLPQAQAAAWRSAFQELVTFARLRAGGE
jgi:hypothetical protein